MIFTINCQNAEWTNAEEIFYSTNNDFLENGVNINQSTVSTNGS